MKLDKNYKMSKPTKIMLNSISDSNHRSLLKALFCEAEQHFTVAKKKMSVKHVDAEPEN